MLYKRKYGREAAGGYRAGREATQGRYAVQRCRAVGRDSSSPSGRERYERKQQSACRDGAPGPFQYSDQTRGRKPEKREMVSSFQHAESGLQNTDQNRGGCIQLSASWPEYLGGLSGRPENGSKQKHRPGQRQRHLRRHLPESARIAAIGLLCPDKIGLSPFRRPNGRHFAA